MDSSRLVPGAMLRSLSPEAKRGEARLGISDSFRCQHASISCALLESGFRLTVRDSPDGAHAFRRCGWIWFRTLELAPFTEVVVLLPAWHSICLWFPCGLPGGCLNPHWLGHATRAL
jgi:hypothetical protein